MARRSRPPVARPRPPVRLDLECLDDRTLPAVGLRGLGPAGALANLLGKVGVVGHANPHPGNPAHAPTANAIAVLQQKLTGAAPAVLDPVTGAVGRVTDAAADTAGGLVGAVTDTTGAVTDAVEGVVTDTVGGVGGAAAGAADGALDPVTELAGVVLPGVAPPEVPPPPGTDPTPDRDGDDTPAEEALPPVTGLIPSVTLILPTPVGDFAAGVGGLGAAPAVNPPAADPASPTTTGAPSGVPARPPADATFGGVGTAPVADLPAPPVTSPDAAGTFVARLPDGIDGGGVRTLTLPVSAPAPSPADLIAGAPAGVTPPPAADPGGAANPLQIPASLAPEVPPESPVSVPVAPAPAEAEVPGFFSRFLPFGTDGLRAGVDRVFAAINRAVPDFGEWAATDWAAVAAALGVGAGVAAFARSRKARRPGRPAEVVA